MHKININLHNLITALIFSMEILRDSSSRHGLRTCQITKMFVAPRPRSEGGVESTPPPLRPPRPQNSQKSPAWLGLTLECVFNTKDNSNVSILSIIHSNSIILIFSWPGGGSMCFWLCLNIYGIRKLSKYYYV